MTFEYEFFLLHAVPYLAEPRRVAVKEWLNKLGSEGWEVFAIAPLRDNEAGLGAYAKREAQLLPQITAATWICDACGGTGSGFCHVCPHCNSGMIRQTVRT